MPEKAPSVEDCVSLLNRSVSTDSYKDSSLNGLQVAGDTSVSSVAVAVDAGQEVIEQAIALNTSLLIVHHGILWSQLPPITGALKHKLKTCFDAGLNVYASHLPLDGDMELGNGVALGRHIGLSSLEPFFEYSGSTVGCVGDNSSGQSREEIIDALATLPGALDPMTTLWSGPAQPRRVGIVTGAGADALYLCKEAGIDTLITGEPRQAAYHFCKEEKLNAIFVGHYASETLGVQELGKLLEREFQLPWTFIDVPTGI